MSWIGFRTELQQHDAEQQMYGGTCRDLFARLCRRAMSDLLCIARPARGLGQIRLGERQPFDTLGKHVYHETQVRRTAVYPCYRRKTRCHASVPGL